MTDDEISENLKEIRFNIEEAKAKYRCGGDIVRLMAVTKTVPYEKINHVIKQGIDLLGENRVQEFLDKKDFYDKCAEVHFIGHLQSNKVKYIAKDIKCIHSVDSISLAEEINRLAAKASRRIDVLAEVNIGGELSKNGVSPDELEIMLRCISQFEHINVRGLMTIPPHENPELFFGRMNELFHRISDMNIPNISMDTLSMGMSADYAIAVRYGSNIVRIGSALFGARDIKRGSTQI